MRRIGRLAGALALGLGVMGVATFGQGPPPPPPPPPGGPGQPFPTLNPGELARWQDGKNVFTTPASIPGGLGPVFNQTACALCHGGPGLPAGSSSPTLTTRFGRITGGQFDPMTAFGGPTLQSNGIGKFKGVNFVGEVVPSQATIVAHRRTIPLFGLGLVDAIPDAVLIGLAAEQLEMSPSTAGTVSLTIDPDTGLERVGRFGWKAQDPTLFVFSGDALINEMGVTNPIFPIENCPQGNCALLAANPAQSSPNQPSDLPIYQLNDFLTFNAPPPPGPTNATTKAGQAIFGLIGCASCHQPFFQAGPSPSTSINGVDFFPYSDFLLHNMGPLGDGITQGTATGAMMRTAPLWGLRFETTFLHDGRASTVDQAIRAHTGQAATAAHNYATLNPTQQAQLLAFLNSI
jgi:CxxC motif-containing protein (DUF1111 family)